MLRFELSPAPRALRALLLAFMAACSSAPPKAPEAPPPAPEAASALPPVLALAPNPPILLREVGFQGPRAALHDPDADVYLVSNTNGGPADADGNGFISRVAPDGTVLELKWIDGAAGVHLDAPKGMALVGEKLYVADLNVLRSFDRKSGRALGKVAIVSASYLNDVALAPDGTLYVSDTGLADVRGLAEMQGNGADAIYAIDPRGSVSVFARGKHLGQPAGLFADVRGVWVTNRAGELYRLAADGSRHPIAQLPGMDLQGLIQTEAGRLVLACSERSTVYMGRTGLDAPADPNAGPASDAFEPLITELETPGDLGYDRGRRQLLVPLVKEDALYIQQIPSAP